MPKRKDKKLKYKERACYAGRSKLRDAMESESDTTPSELSDMDIEDAPAVLLQDTAAPTEHEPTLEEKLKLCFDNLHERNAETRVAALNTVKSCLCRHYVPDVLNEWQVTFFEYLERSWRKNTTEELDLALRVFALFLLQIGLAGSEAVSGLASSLKAVLIDASQPRQLRSWCATSLGICVFASIQEPEWQHCVTVRLSSSTKAPFIQRIPSCSKQSKYLLQFILKEIHSIAEAVHSVWAHTKVSESAAGEVKLFCTTLSSWAFILTHFSRQYVEEAIQNNIAKLCTFFDSPSVDVRICAGETVALLYELARGIYGESYKPPSNAATLATLEEMSMESAKFIAKTEKRHQRATFREIYPAVKEGAFPEFDIKFGDEVLTIETWSSKIQYDIFRRVFAGGINKHLQENVLVREAFALGLPVDPTEVQRTPKEERKAINKMTAKARKIERARNRDEAMADSAMLE